MNRTVGKLLGLKSVVCGSGDQFYAEPGILFLSLLVFPALVYDIEQLCNCSGHLCFVMLTL